MGKFGPRGLVPQGASQGPAFETHQLPFPPAPHNPAQPHAALKPLARAAAPARQGCSAPGAPAPPAPVLPALPTAPPASTRPGLPRELLRWAPLLLRGMGRLAPRVAPAPCRLRRGAEPCSRRAAKWPEVCRSMPIALRSLRRHRRLGLPEAWVRSAAPTPPHAAGLQPSRPREPLQAQAPSPGRRPAPRLGRARRSPWGGRVSPAAARSLAQPAGSVIAGLRRAGAARSHSFLSGSVQSWYETNNFCNTFCFPSLHLKRK